MSGSIAERYVHAHAQTGSACGYALANRGQDTRALQAYLGHKNIQHTALYAEVLDPVQELLARVMVVDQVRFTSESEHCRTIVGCPLCAKSRH